MKTAFIYTDDYVRYDYGETHPLKPYRLQLTRDLIEGYGLLSLPHTCVVPTVPATPHELEFFHTPAYLGILKAANRGTYNPIFASFGLGPGDNPVFPGLYDWSCLCAGGTLQAARLVATGEVEVAFHIAGGLHHALAARASGFCYVNDPAIAITELVRQGYRVAYIDIDVHHGDGVQAAFYDTAQVLTISLHESGEFLFPGSGAVHEIGTGAGRGYAVNLPLPPGIDDDLYVEGFAAVVLPLLVAYKPDIVFTQLGVDTFHDDPLADGSLTTAGFTRVLELLQPLARRWIATGGGGYNLPNVARAWTLAWGLMNGVELPARIPEGTLPALRHRGYRGDTLRDPMLPRQHPHRDRLRAALLEAITYLQRHVFPLHGISS